MNSFNTEFLKGPEAAQFLRISKATFHRIRKRDDFPEPRYVGASPVWRRDELVDWVNAQTAPINA